jgi:hypothetical protein
MRKDIKKLLKAAKKAGKAVLKEIPEVVGKTVKTLDTATDSARDTYNKEFQPAVKRGFKTAHNYLTTNVVNPVKRLDYRAQRASGNILFNSGYGHRILVVMQRPNGTVVSNVFYDPVIAVDYIKKTKAMKYKVIRVKRE